jgi:hypothetical protein
MSQITNKDAVKAIFEGARMPIQETPSELGKTCVPVMDMTPDFHRRCNIVKSAITTGTLYTTPTDKDFYLCSAYGGAYLVGAGPAETYITVNIDGPATRVITMKINGNALTNSETNNSVNPCVPIKIDRGTAIVLTVSADGYGGIIGYTVDIN